MVSTCGVIGGLRGGLRGGVSSGVSSGVSGGLSSGLTSGLTGGVLIFYNLRCGILLLGGGTSLLFSNWLLLLSGVVVEEFSVSNGQ